MTRVLPYFRFAGTRSEIGRAHGTHFSVLIRTHLDLVLDRLAAAGVSPDAAVAAAAEYRPFVRNHASYLDEEIAGIAEGAGISVEEAYLLQIRAEVYSHVAGQTESENECTTFAVTGDATTTVGGLAGQNADLPEVYADLMIVMHLEPEDGPAVLMATPAGQISYIGISDQGMAVFANFLNCSGWTVGFPRYLLSRFALEHGTVASALDALRTLPRASSRNLVLMDATGEAVDFENTPQRDSILRPVDGLLAHSNHYLTPELREEEKSADVLLFNSRVRLARMQQLLATYRGDLDPARMATILRNRDDVPHAISVESGDGAYQAKSGDEPYMTVVSVIAAPAEGRLWVAAGPPSQHEYAEYSFERGKHPGFALQGRAS